VWSSAANPPPSHRCRFASLSDCQHPEIRGRNHQEPDGGLDHNAMVDSPDLDRAREDLQAGRLWKARDRMTGHFCCAAHRPRRACADRRDPLSNGRPAPCSDLLVPDRVFRQGSRPSRSGDAGAVPTCTRPGCGPSHSGPDRGVPRAGPRSPTRPARRCQGRDRTRLGASPTSTEGPDEPAQTSLSSDERRLHVGPGTLSRRRSRGPDHHCELGLRRLLTTRAPGTPTSSGFGQLHATTRRFGWAEPSSCSWRSQADPAIGGRAQAWSVRSGPYLGLRNASARCERWGLYSERSNSPRRYHAWPACWTSSSTMLTNRTPMVTGGSQFSSTTRSRSAVVTSSSTVSVRAHTAS
jgi:hypothetical protein